MPEQVIGDAFVVVAQNIANPRHLGPRNMRVPLLKAFIEMPARLRNDLDAALNNPAFAPVVKGFSVTFFAIDPFDGLHASPDEHAAYPIDI
jgi:hypothetical protein